MRVATQATVLKLLCSHRDKLFESYAAGARIAVNRQRRLDRLDLRNILGSIAGGNACWGLRGSRWDPVSLRRRQRFHAGRRAGDNPRQRGDAALVARVGAPGSRRTDQTGDSAEIAAAGAHPSRERLCVTPHEIRRFAGLVGQPLTTPEPSRQVGRRAAPGRHAIQPAPA